MIKQVMAVALVVMAASGCKKKAGEQPGTGTGTGTGAPADAAVAVDAMVPEVDEGMVSEKLVEQLLAGAPYAEGPALAKDRSRVVWCTAGDNGMADFSEVDCHFAPVGKGKAEVIEVMGYQDAVAIEEASYADDSADPAAKAKAEAAKQRVTAAAGVAKTKAGADLTAFGAAAKHCAVFEGNTDELPGDDIVIADDGSCTIAGAKITLAAGTLTVTAGGKPVLTERFAPRGEVKPEPDLVCTLEAARVEVVLEPTGKVLALQVYLSNPSDTCAMVTEYEIRAVALP